MMPVDIMSLYAARLDSGRDEVGMVFDEGLFVDDATAMVKLEMIRQIRRLGPTTTDQLERAVFRGTTGRLPEEVDWDMADNLAGYRSWLKIFDHLLCELVEEGRIRVDGEGPRTLVPAS